MLLAALVLVFPQEAPVVPLDVVELKSGKPQEGVLLRADDEVVVLGVGTRQKEIDAKKVVGITGPRVAYFGDYVSRMEFVYSEQATASDAVALAEWCADQGMHRDVDLHLWRAVLLDPTHHAAHVALGHRQSPNSGKWEVRTEGSVWLDMEELQKKRDVFDDGWEFTTMHFDIRAAGGLSQVLVAAATLEATYFHFYRLFQPYGKFYELREPIEVRLYKTRAEDYPEISESVAGYYERNSFIVHGFFDGERVANLVRIGAHAVFERSAYELQRSQPTIPGWLYEGFASYLEGCMDHGAEGVPPYRPAHMRAHDFKLHADAEEPLELDRVADLVESDFEAVGDASLAYAQSYTLLYWFLHGAETKIHEAFHGYLSQAWIGRGASSDLKRAVGRNQWKKLDDLWFQFVDAAARRQS